MQATPSRRKRVSFSLEHNIVHHMEAAPDSTPRAERLERAHAVGACSAGDLPASPAPSLDDSGELPMFTPSVIHDPPEHYHTCATFCGDGFENENSDLLPPQDDTIVFQNAGLVDDGYSPLSEPAAPVYEANMEPRDPTGADQVVEEPLLPPAEQEEQADVPKSRLPPQQRQSMAWAFRRSIRPSMDREQDSNGEDSEQQDSGNGSQDEFSPCPGPMSGLSKSRRQQLAYAAEEPSASDVAPESPFQPMSTGGMTPLVHDENHQRTPAGFEVRQDSSLGGSAKISDGQVTARLRSGKYVHEDSACSAPAESPQLSHTGGVADRPVLSAIAAPPSSEQLQNQNAAVVMTAQAPTQSTSGSTGNHKMQTSMLLADIGTPAHDTLPTTRRSLHGATPGILNDNQTLDWTRRGIDMHESMENITAEGLLWEPMGLAEGSEGGGDLPTTPWSAATAPVQAEASEQMLPAPMSGVHEPAMAAAEQQPTAQRERSPSPEAASPQHANLPPGSPSELRRSPRLVARCSKSPSPAPADLPNTDNVCDSSLPSPRRSPRLAGNSPAQNPAENAPKPSPVRQARQDAAQHTVPASTHSNAPSLKSPTIVRSSSKRKSMHSTTPKRKNTTSASPKRSSAPRASPLRNMSKRMRMQTPKSPCPTFGTPLGMIREESKTPVSSPSEEGAPSLSRVLAFPQQWVADDAEPTVRLDHTNGVFAVAESMHEDVAMHEDAYNEPVPQNEPGTGAVGDVPSTAAATTDIAEPQSAPNPVLDATPAAAFEGTMESTVQPSQSLVDVPPSAAKEFTAPRDQKNSQNVDVSQINASQQSEAPEDAAAAIARGDARLMKIKQFEVQNDSNKDVPKPSVEDIFPPRAQQMRTTGGCYIEKWLTKGTDDDPTVSCIVYMASNIRMRMHFEKAGPDQNLLRVHSKFFEFQDCDLNTLYGKRDNYVQMLLSNGLPLAENTLECTIPLKMLGADLGEVLKWYRTVIDELQSISTEVKDMTRIFNMAHKAEITPEAEIKQTLFCYRAYMTYRISITAKSDSSTAVRVSLIDCELVCPNADHKNRLQATIDQVRPVAMGREYVTLLSSEFRQTCRDIAGWKPHMTVQALLQPPHAQLTPS